MVGVFMNTKTNQTKLFFQLMLFKPHFSLEKEAEPEEPGASQKRL